MGREGIIGAATQDPADAADRFAAAHAALRADPAIQFRMTRPIPPPEPPAWLRAIGRWLGELFAPVGRFLRWVSSLMPDAPYARIVLWTVLAAVAVALGWMIVDRARSGEWRLRRPRRRRAAAPVADDTPWTPDAAPMRAWLREADALAAEGRYAEAIHHLLFRAVEDIAHRWPELVRPALTSRELSTAPVLPTAIRAAFADIARLVERSLFAGRPVGAADWDTARAAYAGLATPGTWA